MKRLKYAEDKEIAFLSQTLGILYNLLKNIKGDLDNRLKSYPQMSPTKQEDDLHEYINSIDEAFTSHKWFKTRDMLFTLFGDDDHNTNALDSGIKIIRDYKGLSEAYERVKDQNERKNLTTIPFPQHVISKVVTIVEQLLLFVEVILKRVKEQDSTYVAINKKYDLYELDEEFFNKIYEGLKQHSDFKDYNNRLNKTQSRKAINALYRMHDIAESLIKDFEQIIAIPLDIKIFFSPTPYLKNGTLTTGGSSAYWDPRDSSINFTIASVLNAANDDPKTIDHDYVSQMIAHEAGHMIDAKLGYPSKKPEFTKLLNLIGFNQHEQPKYKGYTDQGKTSEAFADLLAHWCLGERTGHSWAKLEYDTKQNQLINEYFTGLVDRAPYEENDYNQSEYDEDGNVKPEIQQIRNFEKNDNDEKNKIARLKRKVK